MPFKTKRQKLSAAERRFTFSENGAVVYKSSSKQAVAEKDNQSFHKSKKSTTSSEALIEDLGYVGPDLLKIGAFAFLIIALQFLLHLTIFS